MDRQISREALIAAIDGLNAKKAQVDGWILQLQEMLKKFNPQRRGRPPKLVVESQAQPERLEPPKRKLSAKGRKAMIEANKKRWAMYRAKNAKIKKAVHTKVAAPLKKRVISEKQRAELSKRMKKRYKAYGGLKRPAALTAAAG